MKITKEIKNIIVERLLKTLALLILIRIGTFLPIPGIDLNDLGLYLQNHIWLKNLVNTFSDKNIFVISLFTLNIVPYINASILVQLLLNLSPQFSKLQKENDLKSRRIINQLTRLLTLIWAILQSCSLAFYLKRVLFNWNYFLAFDIIIWLTAGAMITLWLSEIITDHCLGNGTSLLVYTNIISNLPNLFRKTITENIKNPLGSYKICGFLIILILLYGIVFLQEGVRNIPLISSKQLKNSTTRLNEIENYIPLKFNQVGIMPIILTSAILTIPNYMNNLGLFSRLTVLIDSDFFKFVYWVNYFILILAFSSFYSKIVLSPKNISNQLQKMAVTVPGVRPGSSVSFYLKQVINRVTLIGACILVALASIPFFVESVLNITSFQHLSTTSLLILAGTILDLICEMKNIYYSKNYNNNKIIY